MNCGLPGVLAKSSPLPVLHAADGETVTLPAILIAPPDRHLMVRVGAPLQLALTYRPTENRTRPAIDPLTAPPPKCMARASPKVLRLMLTR